ncbi:sugar ABC transporter substrate-binding protein [Nonomuraea sp. NPDC050394]|uniref:sugar ABC transporter substrate-binding protein n=1 Tax=Nonomuraea sp. NPDC050394 TaxID=3364363 RepID=UPI0037B3F45A
MRRLRTAAHCLAALSLAVSACGTSADETSGSPGDSTDGKVVWYMDLTDANPTIKAIAQGLNNRLKAAGITLVRTFAVDNSTGSVDLGLQAQGFSRALASRPAAVAYFVVDPRSLKPQVTRAQRAGVPVFAIAGKPEGFTVNAYTGAGDFQQGKLMAAHLAAHLPKGAKVAEITGAPTPNVQEEMRGVRAGLEAAGLTVVGDIEQQRNLRDSPAGGQKVMESILHRFPDVQGVVAYNDSTALGAIAAAKAAGRTPGKDILFTSRNGSAEAVAAVREGHLLATCDTDPIALGAEVGDAIVAQLGGKKTYKDNAELPPTDSSKCLVTKENVAGFVPWDQRVPYQPIKIG